LAISVNFTKIHSDHMPEYGKKFNPFAALEKFPKMEDPSLAEEMDDQEKIFQGEVISFNPELELAKIKKEISGKDLPEKREKIAEFKKKLIEQKKCIAEIQGKLEDIIRDDPDESESFYWRRIADLAAEHRLSLGQKIDFREAIVRYVEKHRNIGKYLKKYQELYPPEQPTAEGASETAGPRWQREFFKSLFGKYPQGRMELEVGPMTLLWKCYNLDDYTLFFGGDKEQAKNSAGVKKNSSVLKGLEGAINAENLSSGHSRQFSEESKKHEEMHSIEELLPKDSLRKLDLALGTESGFAEIAASAARWARYGIKQFEAPAKGEILAYLKEGNASLEYIGNCLLKPAGEGGSYDYLHVKNKDGRDWQYLIKDEFKKLIGRKCGKERAENLKNKIGALMEELLEKEYRHYHEAISRALAAVRDLSDFYPGQNLRKELIALLSQEPLGKWPRLADRLWENHLEKLDFGQALDLAAKVERMERADNLKRIEKFLLRKRKETGGQYAPGGEEAEGKIREVIARLEELEKGKKAQKKEIDKVMKAMREEVAENEEEKAEK